MSIHTQSNPEEEAIPGTDTSRSVKAKARKLTLKVDLMAGDGLSQRERGAKRRKMARIPGVGRNQHRSRREKDRGRTCQHKSKAEQDQTLAAKASKCRQ